MSLETDLQEAIRQHAASRELWQQQSTLHEKTRDDLTNRVSAAVADLAVVGRGTLSKKLCVFQGCLFYTYGSTGGTDDFATITRDSGVEGEAYLHLNTGKKPDDFIILMYHITGADFRGLLNHDARCWGYIGYDGIYSQAANSDPLQPFFYIASNGCGYLRLKLKNQYLNALEIDVTCLYRGDVKSLKFQGGRITSLLTEKI